MINLKYTKFIFMLLVFFMSVAAIFTYFVVLKPKHTISAAQHIQIDGTYLPESIAINDFNLTDNHGQPFTKNQLKGQWTMMFFGFTNCGYVCPTTLVELNKMYKQLQHDLPVKQLPQVVLVSVDPERDTVARMNEYITSYNPHFIGVRGELDETQKLEQQLHITAVKMQPEGQNKDHYTVNHSAEILLFNPQGELQAYLSFPHPSAQMVKDYKAVLGLIDISLG